MGTGPPAAVVHSTPPIRPGPARGGDRVPMSTHQDTNPISPDALVLGYQVRDHHLLDWPPLARTDTYARRCAPSSNSTRLTAGPWPPTARAPPGCPKA